MSKVGTLKELDVKQFDVVEFVKTSKLYDSELVGTFEAINSDGHTANTGFGTFSDHIFRKVLRLKEMSAVEVGEIMLAAYSKVPGVVQRLVRKGSNVHWETFVGVPHASGMYRLTPKPICKTLPLFIQCNQAVLWSTQAPQIKGLNLPVNTLWEDGVLKEITSGEVWWK